MPAAGEKRKKKNSRKSASKKPVSDAANSTLEPSESEKSFPIVGIGASAGGVQALEGFFAELPPDSGMAFVVVQHLDPHHESLMNSLLSKRTQMRVNDAKEGIRVEPNQVYIKAPGKDIVIRDRRLHFHDADSKDRIHLPIDTFFRSLAEDMKEKAICIVLSGASNDGTLGAKLIKGEGGLVVVQDENQAQYPSMPKSVIDAGVADLILPVEQMLAELLRYVDHSFMSREVPKEQEEKTEQDIHSILMIVRTHTGHDFTHYKRNTVRRRIERRMALHQIQHPGDYRTFLRQNFEEVDALFDDLTINVTSFFRDAESFRQLKEVALLPMLKERSPDSSLRIWVPGCATGEEAYSIAIMVVETLEELERYMDIKIFASDINSRAVEAARSGLYPDNISADVSAARLRRFFTRKGPKYQVDSKIRDLTVFALQDVTRDPPFSNVDLVSCRNLLIYMDTSLQKRVIPMLHYALKLEGILFLGTSENTGDNDLFTALDKKNKIFRKANSGAEKTYSLKIPEIIPSKEMEAEIYGQIQRKESFQVPNRNEQVRRIVEQAILKKYSSPAVLLDEQDNILYFHGNTGRFLSPPMGEPNFNIMKMVEGELHYRLSKGIEQVKKNKKPLQLDRVQVRAGEGFLTLDVTLTPIPLRDERRSWLLAEFKEETRPESLEREPQGEKEVDPRMTALEKQLQTTRHELQATIEELETSNEELKSANEELQANNEELQSTNEELESSKEELQSTNEELETVNAELSKRNQDLMKAEDDMINLFASSDIGSIILDNDLCIKRFTPKAKEVFKLQEQRDIGRSISDITSSLDHENVAAEAESVLDTLIRKELRLRSKNGKTFVMRIVPYRSASNVIEGVVLTFLDTTELEKSELTGRDVRSFLYETAAALWEPILILDEKLNVFMANRAFYRLFKTSPNETVNRSIFELKEGQWDIPDLRRFLEEIIPMDKEFEGYQVHHEFPGIGPKKLALNARKIEGGEERHPMILLSFRDDTEKNG
jgi:two-component system, chemotaxis family, CheB/CheR fusion protein